MIINYSYGRAQRVRGPQRGHIQRLGYTMDRMGRKHSKIANFTRKLQSQNFGANHKSTNLMDSDHNIKVAGY